MSYSVSSARMAELLDSATDVKINRKVACQDGTSFTLSCSHDEWQTDTVRAFGTAVSVKLKQKREGETSLGGVVPPAIAAVLVRLSLEGEHTPAVDRNGTGNPATNGAAVAD